MKLYDFFVNANISIKQIITINREYELYLRINKILTVMHKYYKVLKMLNIKVSKKIYMPPKITQFI